jgi:hypothetical protein
LNPLPLPGTSCSALLLLEQTRFWWLMLGGLYKHSLYRTCLSYSTVSAATTIREEPHPLRPPFTSPFNSTSNLTPFAYNNQILKYPLAQGHLNHLSQSSHRTVQRATVRLWQLRRSSQLGVQAIGISARAEQHRGENICPQVCATCAVRCRPPSWV